MTSWGLKGQGKRLRAPHPSRRQVPDGKFVVRRAVRDALRVVLERESETNGNEFEEYEGKDFSVLQD
jgi:hypothetical protein